MNTANRSSEDKLFVRRAVEAAVRIGVMAVVVAWSFLILRPFITPILWGVIIAIAVYPAYRYLTARLGGRRKLTAALLTVLALATLLVPTLEFFGVTVHEIQALSARLEAGTLVIPPPPERVGTWPIIGEDLEKIWSQASTNLEAALERYEPQVKAAGRWLVSAGAGLGLGVLQSTISLIIAGVFLAIAGAGKTVVFRVAERFAPDHGDELTAMMEKTIRSVALGVLGVAIIQAFLGGAAMMIVGVPAATLWALLILILAVIQLPPLLVLGPAIVYVFSTSSTVVAVAFMIWGILVSASDAFLKPLLLGRGVDVPTLVILLGAIGGMILSGIIGLFVGAVVLAIGYQLFMAWLEDVPAPADAPAVAPEG